ncbi:MAG TPA: hypothetical protein VFS81_06390, partial [Candidatus Binatia bacterium]|nr:hypothetical protein [Candidatus Binatia bacterium]
NLFWAAIYDVAAIPIAAEALYPWLSVLLSPEWAALAMSASTMTPKRTRFKSKALIVTDAVHGFT